MRKEANEPSIEQWKRLYELMDELKELAPWEYMYEHNIFGVQFPETHKLGFVSVMGTLGEHYAVAVYTGKKGFEGFVTMQQMGDALPPEVILQVPQIQAAFEDRQLITTKDRAIMKQLGLKFRGKNAWPQFRTFRPGCLPWYLEKGEAQVLIVGLEQLMDVAPRFQANPGLFEPLKPDAYLVRMYENEKWVDRVQKIQFPDDPPLRLSMNMAALNHLKRMAKQNSIVELDIQMMENPVEDNQFDRPFFPFMLLLAEKKSGMILGMDLLCPLPSMEEMWGLFPQKVAEVLASYLLPKEIQVTNPLVALLLSPLAEEVGCKVKLTSHLPTIAHVRRELDSFGRRF